MSVHGVGQGENVSWRVWLGGRQWGGISISGIPAEFSEVTQAKIIVHFLKEQRRAVGDESKELGLVFREA